MTSLKTSPRISFNPFYSQEEFTYNQDPIVINHDTNSVDLLDNNEITETVDDVDAVETQQFSIRPRGERYIDSVYLGSKSDRGGSRSPTSARSVDFDKILSERLSKSHVGESIKLVNTIEYSATDYKGILETELPYSLLQYRWLHSIQLSQADFITVDMRDSVMCDVNLLYRLAFSLQIR